jgi:hypothetical protein
MLVGELGAPNLNLAPEFKTVGYEKTFSIDVISPFSIDVKIMLSNVPDALSQYKVALLSKSLPLKSGMIKHL